ncbi:MAG: hypothetical protein NTX24_00030 [Candidatus Pacearchaeota archaeon]|nr:hypothetical protein [Candidatus Pacearchaeota archaeon]
MANGKHPLLGRDSDYGTLGYLVQIALTRKIFRRSRKDTIYVSLEPSQAGLLIANAVKGEESYNGDKYGSEEKYEHDLAIRLRSQFFSVLKRVEEKGLEYVLDCQKREFKASIESHSTGQEQEPSHPEYPLTLWYLIYHEFNTQRLSMNRNTAADLSPDVKRFFGELCTLLVIEVQQDPELKRCTNPLAVEYGTFFKKIQDYMHKKRAKQ